MENPPDYMFDFNLEKIMIQAIAVVIIDFAYDFVKTKLVSFITLCNELVLQE